ncbi:site-specific integrase [Polynucleobacter sp. MWH-Spelu-300-X4]|uniref:site-specific integrase n=1 Tax=Polynucleobacter sp. MWH-Spelu-300-X4 TaxID=2689109 RepID=UPI001BFD82A8|nr:site-specific integrase [Polynucleobacter sp. MWH-Spelu-300-X4]QWD80056.1 site-specific integrase [Polynucleobacter sp. MWH-Spelu-300-X4]
MKHTNPKDLLNQTIKRMDGAYADSTIRAYRVDFEHFIKYCEELDESPLPTTPETICLYIKSLVQDGRSSASIRRVMAGMTTIHKLNRFPDPTKDPDVILEIRRMHRKIGRYQKQAFGITGEILEKLLLATEAGNRGARDRALLLVAYDTMCRRSELVSLLIEDIRYSETNGVTKASVLIRKSKTDQLAKGRRLNLSQQATEAINLWLERLRNPKEGQLFKGVNRGQKITGSLGSGQISRIYKRLAKRAGLNKELIEQISGHSLRVGHAQDMVNSGESMPMIMSKGRWSKTDTVMRYVEHINYRHN